MNSEAPERHHPPEGVAEKIQKMENDGTILGYRAVVDWDKADREGLR